VRGDLTAEHFDRRTVIEEQIPEPVMAHVLACPDPFVDAGDLRPVAPILHAARVLDRKLFRRVLPEFQEHGLLPGGRRRLVKGPGPDRIDCENQIRLCLKTNTATGKP
jgi:hypothetical protein